MSVTSYSPLYGRHPLRRRKRRVSDGAWVFGRGHQIALARISGRYRLGVTTSSTRAAGMLDMSLAELVQLREACLRGERWTKSFSPVPFGPTKTLTRAAGVPGRVWLRYRTTDGSERQIADDLIVALGQSDGFRFLDTLADLPVIR